MEDVTRRTKDMLEEMYPDMPLLISRSDDEFFATQIANVCKPDGILLSEISIYTKWYAIINEEQKQNSDLFRVKCEGKISYQHKDLGPVALEFNLFAVFGMEDPSLEGFDSFGDQLTKENGLSKSQVVEVLLAIEHQFNVALDTLSAAMSE